MPDDKASFQRAHVQISGRVQGVFFRDAARQKARRLGLAGWVSNMNAGRVEAVLEGEPRAVAEAVRWCGEGPDQAHVEDVDASYEEPRGEGGAFEVR